MIPSKYSQKAIERDRGKCRFCTNIASELHHCWFKSEYALSKQDIDKPFNLASLCRNCHNEIHGYTARGKPMNIKLKDWTMRQFHGDKTQMELKIRRLEAKMYNQ
jgi:5-methylcytosine-specific restriction endonuclease McrA